MSTPMLDSESILNAISQWPQHEQVAIADEILRRAGVALEKPETPNTSQPGTDIDAVRYSHDLAGIAEIFARKGQEPPTDEKVARLLDERRTEKY